MPRLTRWLWLCTLLGYPAAALLSTVMEWDSMVTSYPFRIVVVALSLAALLTYRGMSRAWRRLHPGLKIFFSAYVLRLLWDGTVGGRGQALETLVIFVVVTLLPTLALLSSRQFPGSERRLTAPLLWVGGGIAVAALFAQAIGSTPELTEQTGRLTIEALNPISLGHAMVTAALAGMALILGRGGAYWLPAVVPITAICLLCLMMTASRGPLLALIVALAVPVWRSRYRFAVATAATGIAVVVLPMLLQSDAELIVRLLQGGNDESSLERLLLQRNAFELFLQNPLVGSAFAEFELDTYPHNVFFETAMALGVVGLSSLAWALWSSFRGIARTEHRGSLLLAMVYVQYFFAFQFSGAIFGSAAFWAAVAWFAAPTRRSAPRAARVPTPTASARA